MVKVWRSGHIAVETPVYAAEAIGTGSTVRRAIDNVFDETDIDGLLPPKIGQEPDEQRAVAIGADRQMEVGDVGGHGAAGVDQHHPHMRALGFRLG